MARQSPGRLRHQVNFFCPNIRPSWNKFHFDANVSAKLSPQRHQVFPEGWILNWPPDTRRISILRPANHPRISTANVRRVSQDNKSLSPEVICIFINPLVSKNTGPQLHALVVRFEIPPVLDNLGLAVYVAPIIHTHTQSSATARILPAVPVDMDLHGVRIK